MSIESPKSIAEARAIQEHMRSQVITCDQLDEVKRVAGLDVGFEAGGAITRAAVVVLSYPELRLLEQSLVRIPTRFPYVPGFLSFREIPALLEALDQVSQSPHQIGRAHV